MNKLILPLVIIIGITFFACSSDDDNTDSTTQDQIIGVWNLIAIENQGNTVAAIDCQAQQTITYNSSNSGSEFFPEEISQTPCEFGTTQFSWERNGTELTTTVSQEGSFVSQILVLTDTQLQTVVTEMNGTQVPEAEREIFKYEK